MKFEDALPIILAYEGSEYTDKPGDAGGPTKYGVTQQTLSDWLGRPASADDVRALTPEAVAPIYRRLFWDACRCSELPSGTDLMVFDGATNHGPRRAIRFLQTAVGTTADGIVGPKTLAAAQAKDRVELLKEVAVQRAILYASLDQRFFLGWYRRLFDVFRQALSAT
jgi:lysozyme family protein